MTSELPCSNYRSAGQEILTQDECKATDSKKTECSFIGFVAQGGD